MIRAQDVHGASGDDPVVWEVLAERGHAGRIEQRYIAVRQSERDGLDDFEAFKAATVAVVSAWEQGEEPLQAVDGEGHGSGNAEVSGLDRRGSEPAAGAAQDAAASPDTGDGDNEFESDDDADA